MYTDEQIMIKSIIIMDHKSLSTVVYLYSNWLLVVQLFTVIGLLYLLPSYVLGHSICRIAISAFSARYNKVQSCCGVLFTS